MNADVSKKQDMLEEMEIKSRVMKVLEHLSMESQMLEMRNEIHNKVRKDLDKQQREYFLHQQMRTIQDELGDNPQEQDVRDFRERAKTKKWPRKKISLHQYFFPIHHISFKNEDFGGGSWGGPWGGS